MLLGLVIAIVGAVSADNATHPFGESAPNTDFGWQPMVAGDLVGVDVLLDPVMTGAKAVYSIEVFLKNSTTLTDSIVSGTPAAFVRTTASGGSLPTGQVINIRFSFLNDVPASVRQNAITPPAVAGIHLMGRDNAGNPVLVGRSVNPALKPIPAPTATPVPPAEPTPTPVTTVVVPESQVTAVAAPAGGASKIVQPNAAATLSAPDGSVTVNLPPTSSSKTFQVTYAPLTTGVPAASPKTQVLRAFALTTYGTDGAKTEVTLLQSVTISAKYTSADSQAAPDKNPANLRILSYDDTTKVWSLLNTTVDIAGQMLTAKVSHLSTFAVGSAEPPPQTVEQLQTPTPTATPVATATPTRTPAPAPTSPPTGDFAPSSGLVLAVMLAGLLMVLGGATYITQSRRSRA
ncbi:MAG: hypothetical protein HY681_03925 [Chloroflexi bacterium]|nr:hypothetical protein [Chloroflexota bacterium]